VSETFDVKAFNLQLCKALDIDPDKVQSITITTDADGPRINVTLVPTVALYAIDWKALNGPPRRTVSDG
jgi:hypothetical protein